MSQDARRGRPVGGSPSFFEHGKVISGFGSSRGDIREGANELRICQGPGASITASELRGILC